MDSEPLLFSPQLILDCPAWGSRTYPVGLDALLAQAFTASLYSNEGRHVRFVLAVKTGNRRFPYEAPLKQPMPITPLLLRQLAFATHPTDGAFGVALDDHGVASIVSLIDRVTEVDPSTSERPAIEVSVLGPGCVALRIDETDVRFDRDRIVVTKDPGAHRFPPESIDAFAEIGTRSHLMSPTKSGQQLLVFDGRDHLEPIFVERDAWDAHKGAIQDLLRKAAPFVLEHVLTSLVTAIARLGHGGAVLVMPRAPSSETTELIPKAHWFEYASTWNGTLREYALWLGHYALASEKGVRVLAGGDPNAGDVEEWRDRVLEPRLRTTFALIQQEASRIAHLSQVDGALVLSPLLAPVAFGATLATGRELVGSALSTECARFLEGRGHRHGSLASAVSRVSGSIGVAISSDGDATRLFHGPNGEVEHEAMPLQ